MKTPPPEFLAVGALVAFVLYRHHVASAGGAVPTNPDPYGTASGTEFANGSGAPAPNGYYYDPSSLTPGTPVPGTPAPVGSPVVPVPPVTQAPVYTRPILYPSDPTLERPILSVPIIGSGTTQGGYTPVPVVSGGLIVSPIQISRPPISSGSRPVPVPIITAN